MEGGLLTEILLPVALAVIMLGMGLSLVTGDFKRILVHPKAILIGLFNQLILLPLLGFGLMYLFPIKPEYAVGIILLAACPGGPTSNLIAYLGRGDGALSISLTAFSSLVTIITIPFIVNYGMQLHMGASAKFLSFSIKG
jgi:bile acid:Na+ symporter, BASS family